MKLIIDSGSTKSDLAWMKNGEVLFRHQTEGINPFYQKEDEIFNILNGCCSGEMANETSQIYHYGAGCSFQDKCEMVVRPLKKIFPNAEVDVNNDLLGAARSLFQDENGIACILGTGSNTCYYDGKEIQKNIPPLGFILGDEGSGASLGKLFVGDILKSIAPHSVIQQFYDETGITAQDIMDHVYKKSFPNRYLAQFSKYIHLHKSEAFFQDLIIRNFDIFFKRNIHSIFI